MNNLKVEKLSEDFKLELPEERKRIENKGGIVKQIHYQGGLGIGPFRVFFPGENYPGLNMSRTIGDALAKTLGLIAEPGIKDYNLSSKDKFLIICSDGVWEFLNNEEVKEFGIKYYLENDPKKLCEDLYKKAKTNWENNDQIVDDITIIAVFF